MFEVRVWAFVATVLIAAMAAPAAADEVWLADGSRLKGTIAGLDNGRLALETTFAGTVMIAADQVIGLSTDEPRAISLGSRDRVVGRLSFADGRQRIVESVVGDVAVGVDAIIAITAPDAPPPMVESIRDEQQAEIKQLEQRHEEQIKEIEARLERVEPIWSTRLQIGVTGKTGNTERAEFNGRVETKRETKTDRLLLYAQGAWAKDSGERTDNEIIGGARYELDRTDRTFLFIRGELEYDEFEDLDLRATVSGGVGYFLIKKDPRELKLRAGLGYRHESFTDGVNRDEGIFELGYDLRWDINETLRFTQSVTYLPSITDSITEEYRIVGDTALELPIGTGETWKVRTGMRNDFDNSPQPGIDRLDTTYYLNLVCDW